MVCCQRAELEPKESVGFSMPPQPWSFSLGFCSIWLQIWRWGFELFGFSSSLHRPSAAGVAPVSLSETLSWATYYIFLIISFRWDAPNSMETIQKPSPTQTHRGGRWGTQTPMRGGKWRAGRPWDIYVYLGMKAWMFCSKIIAVKVHGSGGDNLGVIFGTIAGCMPGQQAMWFQWLLSVCLSVCVMCRLHAHPYLCMCIYRYMLVHMCLHL